MLSLDDDDVIGCYFYIIGKSSSKGTTGVLIGRITGKSESHSFIKYEVIEDIDYNDNKMKSFGRHSYFAEGVKLFKTAKELKTNLAIDRL